MLRLICFLLIFAVFLVFIGLNLGNNCDVNLGFRTFTNTPVYITALGSFFLGMLCSIPVLLAFKDRKQQKPEKKKKDKAPKKNKSPEEQQEEAPKENELYGVD